METFTIRDLRERTGALVRGATSGKLSLVTRHGRPVFVAVPIDQTLVREGLAVTLALKLYADHAVSLGKAARIAGMPVSRFIGVLGAHGLEAVRYSPRELKDELAALD
jgi:prevent-host-death family protein